MEIIVIWVVFFLKSFSYHVFFQIFDLFQKIERDRSYIGTSSRREAEIVLNG